MKTFVGVLVLTLSVFLVKGASDEDRLVANLLRWLGKTGSIARPVMPGNESSDPVNVSLGLALLRVASLMDSSAEMDVWIQMAWKDPRLSWDPAEFNGLRQVALPSDLLWIPDVRPFHAGNYMPDRVSPIRTIVRSNSEVIYVLPARLRAPCDRLRNGSVLCRPILGSWVYNGFELNTTLNDNPFSMTEFEPLAGWEVASATVERVESFYACCPEPYISIKYSLLLNKTRGGKGGKGGKGGNGGKGGKGGKGGNGDRRDRGRDEPRRSEEEDDD